VVDFDDLHAYEQLAARFPCVTEAPRVQTRKGYHVYFSYNRVANMSIPHEHKIDLQSLASRKAASARRNATRTSSSANASAPAPADGDIEPEEETELTVEEKTELARQFLSEVAARRWVSIDGSASSRLVYVFDSRSGLWSCKAEAFYRRRVASVRA